MKRYSPEGYCVDPEAGIKDSIYLHGCDLYLLDQWDNESAESDGAQLMHIFERFLDLSIDERLVWETKLDERGVHAAENLTQAERDLLFRVRPLHEMTAAPAGPGEIMLRTYYGPGSDEAFAELDDLVEEMTTMFTVLNDKALYDFGSDWQRVFTRIPQLLAVTAKDLAELAPLKEEACRVARGLPLDDYSGYAPHARPQVGQPWPLAEAFSTYQQFSNRGFLIVLDELALGPNWRAIDALTPEQQAAEAAVPVEPVYWDLPGGSKVKWWGLGGGTGQRWWPPVQRDGEYWEARREQRKMLAGWYDAGGAFTRWNWLTADELRENWGIVSCGYDDMDIWENAVLDEKRLEAYVEAHKAAEQKGGEQTLVTRGKDSEADEEGEEGEKGEEAAV